MTIVSDPRVWSRASVVALTLIVWLMAPSGIGAETSTKAILSEHKHSSLACTNEELGRLRQAYQSQNPEREIVARPVREAEGFISETIVFPPRGGQHNQWYQCDQCQIALKTIDATHHRCPKCGKVYSGYPYDDVIFSQQHSRNLDRMLTAAWAYAISQEERFAEYAARVLLGYAERYKSYPYHSASLEPGESWARKSGGHLFEQTLTEASSLAGSIGPAYDLIHDSRVLSREQHNKIRQELLLPMLDNIDKNKAGKSNWQTWHNAAMIWGGALIHDPAWVTKAIEDQQNGFYYQMSVSVSKEGMWYENSWGYHFYTLSALVNMAEAARHLGIDLWSDGRLRKMFTLPVYYTMANGMLPRFGDDVNSSLRRTGRLLEPAYRAYQDPQILALLGDVRDFEAVRLGRSVQSSDKPPSLQSMVFDGAGHAILRTHAEAGLTAAMTFGPYGGFHGHYDKLSFVFFGFDEELGVDPGRARSQAYRLPIHTNWYKATISHNAVLVDRASQKPATGTLKLFECQNDYTAVAAACDQAYPGVEHTRWLVMTGAYLLVVDVLACDAAHQFDWIYHNKGDKVTCEAAQDNVSLTGQYPGGEYIENCRRGTSADIIRVQFENPQVTTHLTMAAQEGTTVTIGQGVGASITDRVPMVMISRAGRDVHFASVLEPVAAGGKPCVTGIRCARSDEGITVVVQRDHQTDSVRILRDSKVQVALSEETDVPRFLPGKQVGAVQTKEIKEASGIVASRMNRGVLWVHNDSGNSAKVYALNAEGKLLGTYRLKGARCRDWEDIAIGSGPDPLRYYLYIGDLGDNEAKYPSVTVYRVAEPEVDPSRIVGEIETGPADAIEFTYPDGPKDAETLLVDPLRGDIYVIAKREFRSRVYRAACPQLTAKPTTMELVTTLRWGFAVGGDVSPDGQWIIVRGPFNASLWRRPAGKELWQAFATEDTRLQLVREPQGEGICFDADGRGYFTIGEQTRPPIYYFVRAGSSASQDD